MLAQDGGVNMLVVVAAAVSGVLDEFVVCYFFSVFGRGCGEEIRIHMPFELRGLVMG